LRGGVCMVLWIDEFDGDNDEEETDEELEDWGG
jgi:hypothetical protein